MNERHGLEDGIALLDRVLVEADIDGRPVSLRAVIVRICPTELWLGLGHPMNAWRRWRPAWRSDLRFPATRLPW